MPEETPPLSAATSTIENDAGITNPNFMKGLEAAAIKDSPKVAADQPGKPVATPEPKQSKLSRGIRSLTKPGTGDSPEPRADGDAPSNRSRSDPGASPIPDDDYKPGMKAEDWKRIKTAERTAIERAVKAEQALESARAEASKPFKIDLDRVRQENEKLLTEIEKINIERSPRFNAEFEAKTGSILGRLRGVVPSSDLSKVQELVKAPNGDARISALEEVMNGLSPLKQRTFADVVSAFDTAQEDRQFQIQQAFQNSQKEQTTAAQRVQAEQAEFDQAFESEVSKWRGNLTSENPEWNAALDESLARAKGYASGQLDKSTSIQRDLWAGIGPMFAELVDKQTSRIEELEGQLKAFDKAAADFGRDGGGASDATVDPSKEIQRHGGVGEALMAGFKGSSQS